MSDLLTSHWPFSSCWSATRLESAIIARVVRVDVWSEGSAYESYIGRWSRLVAEKYIVWLRLPRDLQWLDVGCGAGALSRTIVEGCSPRRLTALDRSPNFARAARQATAPLRVDVCCADAQALPLAENSVDAVVSGLVLNFVPDTALALREMRRVARAGGVVSAYVWDYAEGMELIRLFWEEARVLDDGAADLDEARRFPLCQPGQLESVFQKSGLHEVDVSAIVVPTVFRDFDDYWSPFLRGQGPAPTYVTGMNTTRQAQLRERLRQRLPARADGTIHLSARAWAVRGVNP